jgi:hypothetical protein
MSSATRRSEFARTLGALAVLVIALVNASEANANCARVDIDTQYFAAPQVAFEAVERFRLTDGAGFLDMRIRHAGGWIRADEVSPSELSFCTSFEAPDRDVRIWWYAKGRSEGQGFSVLRGPDETTQFRPLPAPRAIDPPETALGETCQTYITREDAETPGSRFRTVDCLTPDGIRLWRRQYDWLGNIMIESQLVRLERNTATTPDVEPPLRLFNLAYWLGAAATRAPAAPVMQVRLERVDAPNIFMLFARSGPWTKREVLKWDGGRRITFRNAETGVLLSLDNVKENTRRELNISTGLPPFLPDPSSAANETILDRRCRIDEFATSSALSEASYFVGYPLLRMRRCVTENGTPLMEVFTPLPSPNRLVEFRAVSIATIEGNGAKVEPDPSILDPLLWLKAN